MEGNASWLAHQVVSKTQNLYNSLGKKGKPQQGREWTLLASFVKTDSAINNESEVICLATGSKCIGKGKRKNDGSIVNDSHAEILARRLLLRYLYDQITKAVSGCQSIFVRSSETSRFVIKPGIQFHLFTSQTPCGDCSIFPKEDKTTILASKEARKRKESVVNAVTEADVQSCHKKLKVDSENGLKTKEDRENQKNDALGGVKDESFVESVNCLICVEETSSQGTIKCDSNRHQDVMANTKDLYDKGIDKSEEVDVTEEYEESFHLATKKQKKLNEIPEDKDVDKNVDMRIAKTYKITHEAVINSCEERGYPVAKNEQKFNEFPDGKDFDKNVDMRIATTYERTHREEVTKNEKNFKDIYRTGAKCVPAGKQDLNLDGEDYHISGVLRTKPGRGERTLSMSCSDKIMKWCTLGLQGGLLSNFLESPIYLTSIIIGKCPFNKEAMERGVSLKNREYHVESASGYRHTLPSLYQSNDFEFVQSKEKVDAEWSPSNGLGKVAPSGSAILFCKDLNIHEVLVNGKKQGLTKKHNSGQTSWSSVSKAALFTEFKTLLATMNTSHLESKNPDLGTYQSYKYADTGYAQARSEYFKTFPDWIAKPTEDEMFT